MSFRRKWVKDFTFLSHPQPQTGAVVAKLPTQPLTHHPQQLLSRAPQVMDPSGHRTPQVITLPTNFSGFTGRDLQSWAMTFYPLCPSGSSQW